MMTPNCTQADEFEYKTPEDSESSPVSAGINSYGGGGYVLKLKGYITKMEQNIDTLKRENWVDNRTRSLILEFSVYNAQVRHNNYY